MSSRPAYPHAGPGASSSSPVAGYDMNIPQSSPHDFPVAVETVSPYSPTPPMSSQQFGTMPMASEVVETRYYETHTQGPDNLATVTVTGIDRDHNGIPDVLEGGQTYIQAVESPSTVYSYQGQATESVEYTVQPLAASRVVHAEDVKVDYQTQRPSWREDVKKDGMIGGTMDWFKDHMPGHKNKPPASYQVEEAQHMASVTVTGVDRNHDGIPDVLQGMEVLSRPPTAPTVAAVATPVPVEVVEHHEKVQVTDYVTMREEKVVAVPQVQVVETQVPVVREVDRIVTEEVRTVPTPTTYAPAIHMESVSSSYAMNAPPMAVESVSPYAMEAQHMASVTVTGVDRNHDGIPDVLQGMEAYPTVAARVIKGGIGSMPEYPPAPAPPLYESQRMRDSLTETVTSVNSVPISVVQAQPTRTAPMAPAAYSTVQETVIIQEPPAMIIQEPIYSPPPPVQSAPVVAKPVAPTTAPPPSPPASIPSSDKINYARAIPFCAEFLGTFILVFTLGLGAMYGLGTAPPVVSNTALLSLSSGPSYAHLLETKQLVSRPACRRCDNPARRTSALQTVNATQASLLQEQVVSVAHVAQSIQSMKFEQALQQALNVARSTTFWCSDYYNNPVFGIFLVIIIYGVLLFFIRPMSGAHMNPAISFAAFLSGKLEPMAMLIYWCAQVLGSLLAALFFAVLVGFDCLGVGPRDGFGWWQASVAELMFTALLAFTFLSIHPTHKGSVKENKYNIFLYPATLVAALCAGIAASSHISGAFLNPAVTIGLDVVRELLYPETTGWWWFGYVFVQLLGGVLAAVVFYICRPDERRIRSRVEDNRMIIFPLTTKLACEFVGTWIFTFTVTCSYWSFLKIDCLAGAACLICVYTALCMVCGGHFNPAVTLAVMVSERHDVAEWLHDGLWYMAIQTLAATLAAFECAAVHYGATYEAMPLPASWGIWGLVEILLTCILVLAFMACTRTRDEVVVTHLRYQIALAIAFCFAVTGTVLDWFVMSGSYLNPALAIGNAFANMLNGGVWWTGVEVAFFEFLGGILAYGVFVGFREHEQKQANSQRVM